MMKRNKISQQLITEQTSTFPKGYVLPPDELERVTAFFRC